MCGPPNLDCIQAGENVNLTEQSEQECKWADSHTPHIFENMAATQPVAESTRLVSNAPTSVLLEFRRIPHAGQCPR
jgi:hypothetical protein